MGCSPSKCTSKPPSTSVPYLRRAAFSLPCSRCCNAWSCPWIVRGLAVLPLVWCGLPRRSCSRCHTCGKPLGYACDVTSHVMLFTEKPSVLLARNPSTSEPRRWSWLRQNRLDACVSIMQDENLHRLSKFQ